LAEVQPLQVPESSLQAKVEPLSVAEKPMLAVVEVVVPGGADVIAVSGGLVSAGGGGVVAWTVQLRVAGDASTLPAASTAFTAKL
jgi:hypothetical protein